PEDLNIQQATVNLLADMGVQPQTLQSNLVQATQSTDHLAPTTTIDVMGNPQSVVEGQIVTVEGTAIDSGGGRIAGIEVSTDGGTTWHPAVGTTTWTYQWTAQGPGNHVIEA